MLVLLIMILENINSRDLKFKLSVYFGALINVIEFLKISSKKGLEIYQGTKYFTEHIIR